MGPYEAIHETIRYYKGLYGTIRYQMGPCETILDNTGPYEAIRDPIGPYGTIDTKVMGKCRQLCEKTSWTLELLVKIERI